MAGVFVALVAIKCIAKMSLAANHRLLIIYDYEQLFH
jgi:hypothetical protein